MNGRKPKKNPKRDKISEIEGRETRIFILFCRYLIVIANSEKVCFEQFKV